jgi:hypothetical protein
MILISVSTSSCSFPSKTNPKTGNVLPGEYNEVNLKIELNFDCSKHEEISLVKFCYF